MAIKQARMKNQAMIVPDILQPLLALGKAAKNGGVPSRTLDLVHLRASQINGCSVCVDMHSRDLKKAGETDERLFAVAAWHEAPYFTEAERAALALTKAATRLSDRADPVPDEIWREAAEHVVQDTLCRALETWPVQGLPDNPSAWLMRVARNRAVDLLRRDDQFRYFAPELTYLLRLREELPVETPAFEKGIQDDQLRMMFSCCHPDLSTEVQATLILKTLCGFSVSEIAHALLASEDSIEKRLGRARKLFRLSGTFVEITSASEIRERLEAVYQAIYLLFNEGYHGSRSEPTVREDLCFEAIRLALLLSEHPEGKWPRTYALLALLCFHAARLPGRTDDDGALIQLEIQDRSKWDRDLIGRGFHFLEKSSAGTELSEYHLEAGIAALHCAAPTYEETEWAKILDLYDVLYRLKPSPIVALNRAIALGKALGPEEGLVEFMKIPDPARLKNYLFYPAAQGEFHLLAGRPAEAAKHFEKAMKLSRSQPEKNFFERKLRACRSGADQPDDR